MMKAIGIAGLIAACGGGQAAPGGAVASEPGFFVAAGAPAPRVCAADPECVVAGTLDESGCCWSYRDLGAVAQSRAYAAWATGWKAACGAARCPSPPVPQDRPACVEAARCVAGRCRNACE